MAPPGCKNELQPLVFTAVREQTAEALQRSAPSSSRLLAATRGLRNIANIAATSDAISDLAAAILEASAAAANLSTPLVRRHVAAALAEAAFSPTPPPLLASMLAAASQALQQAHQQRLGRLEKASPTNRAVHHVLHISKAGGTSLCNLARLNGLATHPQANNCHPPATGPLWFASFRQSHRPQTCADYRAMVAEAKLDIVANEAALDGDAADTLCDADMVYMTMLREPTSRAVSHSSQAGVKPAGLSNAAFRALGWEAKLKVAPNVLANYQLRMLLGADAYDEQAVLDAAGLAQAQALLARFDVVAVIEDKALLGLLLERMLGWTKSDLDSKVGRRANRKDSGPPPDSAAGRHLAEANVLDRQLWDFARALGRLDVAVFSPQNNPNTNPNTTSSSTDANHLAWLRNMLQCGTP